MRIRSYYSDSVEEAMARASAELGGEAMLVFAKEAAPEDRHMGRHEVVFAVGAPSPPPTSAQPPEPAPAPESAAADAPASPLGRVRAELVELRGILAREGPRPAARQEIVRRVRTDAAMRRPASGPWVAIFAGPAGAGKTSSVVKLASRLVMQGQPPPALVGFDTRVGAAEPLRSYAAALGAAHEMASTVAGVEAAVGRAEGLVLVDTAGLSRRDRAGADAMASLREAFPGADLVLVLTADAKPADLSSAVERFSRFRPTRLLFTRLDETGTFGPLWSEAVRRDLPVCFLSFGPGIPEDFEPATAVRLADLATSPGTGAIGTGMLSKLDSRRRAAAA